MYKLLHERVLGKGDQRLHENEFDSAVHIVATNAVRARINREETLRFAERTGLPRYLCTAHDLLTGPSSRQYQLQLLKRYDKECSGLAGTSCFVETMPVILTITICPELGLMNGTMGTLVRFLLHPEEHPANAGEQKQLRYFPLAAVVKSDPRILPL